MSQWPPSLVALEFLPNFQSIPLDSATKIRLVYMMADGTSPNNDTCTVTFPTPNIIPTTPAGQALAPVCVLWCSPDGGTTWQPAINTGGASPGWMVPSFGGGNTILNFSASNSSLSPHAGDLLFALVLGYIPTSPQLNGNVNGYYQNGVPQGVSDGSDKIYITLSNIQFPATTGITVPASSILATVQIDGGGE